MASRYPFEYFCGANVVVYLDDFPLLEASGFSYSIRESKRPIYGYASRMFDAVARGQVLVEGTILINYVHQDYLFHAATLAQGESQGLVKLNSSIDTFVDDELGSTVTLLDPTVGERLLSGADISEAEIAAAKKYWEEPDTDVTANVYGVNPTSNMHDAGSFNIRVGFGMQRGDRPAGDTGFLLTGVHFTGRGETIQIDAETIVEAYSFIARNVYSTVNPTVMLLERTPDGVQMTTAPR